MVFVLCVEMGLTMYVVLSVQVVEVIWVCCSFLYFHHLFIRISLIVLSLFLFIVCNVFAPFSHFKSFMLSLCPCKFIKH
jgi:hypothetical protein